MRDDGRETTERQPGLVAAVLILAAHLAVVGAALVLLHQPVSLNPTRAEPTTEIRRCAPLPVDDDLFHMALRPADRAKEQARRWTSCAPPTIDRARDALRWDHALIAVIALGIGMAIVRGFLRVRWRWSAFVALLFLGAYVFTDVAENHLLNRYLDDRADWTDHLRWVAAVKLGSFLAALPMFLVSFVIALGDIRRARPTPPPDETAMAIGADGGAGTDEIASGTSTTESETDGTESAPAPPTLSMPAAPEPSPRLGARLRQLVVGNTEWSVPPTSATTGDVTPTGDAGERRPGRGAVEPDAPRAHRAAVACSGGGIRSAAFNLGALQALDVARAGPDEPSELAQAHMISAVSGGSYMAASWVAARHDWNGQGAPPWIRCSPDEDHLRRHTSYIAPGIAGKLWAFLRFVLGFAMNLVLIVLTIAAVALPYGWAIGAMQESVPSSGGAMIRLSDGGGVVRLASGRAFIVEDREELRLASGETAHLAPDAVPIPPAGAPTPAHPELPAATDGRKLDPGTRVVIEVDDHPLEVDGRVLGRLVKHDNGRRTLGELRYISLGDGSRLTAADDAELTVKGAAIVERATLVKACGAHACERISGSMARWTVGFLLFGLVLGMIAVAVRPRERWRAKAPRAVRLVASIGIIAVVAILVLPELVSWAEGQRWSIEERRSIAGVSVLTILLAIVAQLSGLLGSGTAPSSAGKVVGMLKRVGAGLRPILVRVAAYLAAPLLLLAVALFFASLGAQRELEPTHLAFWLASVGALLVVGLGADLNQWSLHPYYRERLASAFGVQPDLDPRPTSRLQDLPAQPKLVVCAAANVADGRITPPGRPVLPWVFAQDEVGAEKLCEVYPDASGTVDPAMFTGKLAHLGSLWTSVAVSGAAFSPSMGKMSRPERGLMVLGNLRLGVWYPNPAMLAHDPDWYQAHHPRPTYLVKELFGLHRATDKWIYVTDGGHDENLGLVELLRRGVRCIYCFDASGDSIDTFGTIAEALRLARQELAVEIDFDPTLMKPDKDGVSPLGARAATIFDRDANGQLVATGWLVVAKLEVPRKAPFDIIDLARTLPKFPNNPTSDQLYTDQKFEAYRALGYYLGAQAAALGIKIKALRAAGNPIQKAVETANLAISPPPETA